MLEHKEFSKVNFSSEISEMKRKMQCLEDLGEVSYALTFSLEARYSVDKRSLVSSISTDSTFLVTPYRNDTDNLSCIVHFNDLSDEDNVLIWEIAKATWRKQSTRLKKKIALYVGTETSHLDDIKNTPIEDEKILFIEIFYKRDSAKCVNERRYEMSKVFHADIDS